MSDFIKVGVQAYDWQSMNINKNCIVRIEKRKEEYGDGSSFFPWQICLSNGESFNITEEDKRKILNEPDDD
jgi:hypothetical protein